MTPLQVLQGHPPHDETLPGLLASRCAALAGHELLTGELRGWRYGQARDGAELLAGALCGLGVAPGDRVVLVSLNSDWAPLLLLALGRVGAVFVPSNPALTPQELAYVVGHCGTKLILSAPEDIARVRDAVALVSATSAATSAAVPRVMSTNELDGNAADAAGVLRAFEQLPKAPLPAAPQSSDPLIIIYTSGTTGFPKGVVHSHRNYVLAAEAFVERLHLQPGERLMAILPFFHINALFYSFGGAIACGGTLITIPKFSASSFWSTAARFGATTFNILAAVGNILARRDRSEFEPAHRIRKIYGGPIPAEMMKVFQEEFSIPELIEGFGMSEIPGALNNPFDGVRKIGSIGLPARHPRFPQGFAQARIADDDGRELPDGETGELQVKTPIAMLHYFNDPKQSAEAFLDGWLRTGDLAWRDEDGYFYYVARKKDIIRRRGENIAGAELDRVLGEHPQIVEAAAIGVPAPLGDEDILVVLVARSSPPPSPQQIIDWCTPRLAAMKVPRYIVYAEALPHTPTQRIAKYVLKQDKTLVARAWDREAPRRDD